MTVTDFDLGILDRHALALSKDAAMRSPADAMLSHALRRVLEAYRSAIAVPPAEERVAWDMFVNACTDKTIAPHEAAAWADKALEQRRERFGGSR